MGWVQASRGSIEVKNRSALSSYGSGEADPMIVVRR